jgi:AcrR family transcriptional regulator
MKSARKKTPRKRGTDVVWERPEPPSRPAPGPLSRERIVRAAVALADAEGLASVSLRKVGASLDAGPMRLYGYMSTKEELLDLMVDSVYGELMGTGPLRGDWRESLRQLARRTRQAARAHPWFVDLLGGRPHLGPHGLEYLEALLAAVGRAPGFEAGDAILLAARTVNAYVVGSIRSEASELRAEAESGLSKKEWQAASWPYVQRMMESGRFPTFAQTVRKAVHPSADTVFDEGLECVLDGLVSRHRR